MWGSNTLFLFFTYDNNRDKWLLTAYMSIYMLIWHTKYILLAYERLLARFIYISSDILNDVIWLIDSVAHHR